MSHNHRSESSKSSKSSKKQQSSSSNASASSTSSQASNSSRSHVHRTQRTSPTWSPSSTNSAAIPSALNAAAAPDDVRSSSAALPRASLSNAIVTSSVRRHKSGDRAPRRSSSSSTKSNQSGRKSVTREASISAFESYASELHDPHLVSEELRQEFSRSNMEQIVGTSCDPERFFRPGNENYFERRVNPHKIIDFMVNYMNSYFDLMADPKPYSSHRENLDEHLWDHMAYVFPIACRNVVEEVLRDEPLVVTLMPNVVVFGDIHGNLSDIYYIYKHYISNKKYCSHKFIFLGDYVDRGPKSIEVCMFLVTCKLIDPKRFFLLRGNHEVSKVNTKYGFKCLVETIFKETYLKSKGMLAHLIYESFNRVFSHLPVAAAIRFKDKRGVFCCHGGIPNEKYKPDSAPWKISDINAFTSSFKPHSLIPRHNAPTGQIVLNEILWNDPIPRKVWEKRRNMKRLFYKNKKRGGHCSWFTEDAVNRFLDANNMKLVIRGHQYKNTRENGFAYHFPGQQVMTVFSSSNYCGVEDNVTGCVVITEESIQPKVLRTIEESKNYRQFNAFELVTDDNKKVVGVVY